MSKGLPYTKSKNSKHAQVLVLLFGGRELGQYFILFYVKFGI
jgi:hypothetical protein